MGDVWPLISIVQALEQVHMIGNICGETNSESNDSPLEHFYSRQKYPSMKLALLHKLIKFLPNFHHFWESLNEITLVQFYSTQKPLPASFSASRPGSPRCGRGEESEARLRCRQVGWARATGAWQDGSGFDSRPTVPEKKEESFMICHWRHKIWSSQETLLDHFERANYEPPSQSYKTAAVLANSLLNRRLIFNLDSS